METCYLGEIIEALITISHQGEEIVGWIEGKEVTSEDAGEAAAGTGEKFVMFCYNIYRNKVMTQQPLKSSNLT